MYTRYDLSPLKPACTIVLERQLFSNYKWLESSHVADEYWAHLGRQLEARHARRLEELGADPYADLDAHLLESDDGGAEVVREQRAAGVPVWGYDDAGNLVST